MASYNSADILCPFYRRDKPKTSELSCEGVLPGSTVKSFFPTREALQEQVGRFCAKDYEQCPWYRVASLKWGGPY